jgi:hypothetical protein
MGLPSITLNGDRVGTIRVSLKPAASNRAQLLEAKANLQHMLLEIPLTETERAAVEEGTTAVEQLIERLKDTPTPAGPSPRDLHATFIPLDALTNPARST